MSSMHQKKKEKENKVLIVEWLWLWNTLLLGYFATFTSPFSRVHFAISPVWQICQVHIAITANLAILIFERALPLKLQKSQSSPKRCQGK
jgi:hypothetical protein